MPPCHGGDRRFESGRARQNSKTITQDGFLFCTNHSSLLIIVMAKDIKSDIIYLLYAHTQKILS